MNPLQVPPRAIPTLQIFITGYPTSINAGIEEWHRLVSPSHLGLRSAGQPGILGPTTSLSPFTATSILVGNQRFAQRYPPRLHVFCPYCAVTTVSPWEQHACTHFVVRVVFKSDTPDGQIIVPNVEDCLHYLSGRISDGAEYRALWDVLTRHALLLYERSTFIPTNSIHTWIDAALMSEGEIFRFSREHPKVRAVVSQRPHYAVHLYRRYGPDGHELAHRHINIVLDDDHTVRRTAGRWHAALSSTLSDTLHQAASVQAAIDILYDATTIRLKDQAIQSASRHSTYFCTKCCAVPFGEWERHSCHEGSSISITFVKQGLVLGAVDALRVLHASCHPASGDELQKLWRVLSKHVLLMRALRLFSDGDAEATIFGENICDMTASLEMRARSADLVGYASYMRWAHA